MDLELGGDFTVGANQADGTDPVLTAGSATLTNTGVLTFYEDEDEWNFSEDHHYYAEMAQNGNSNVTTINTQDVWEEVDNFSTGDVSGWTFGGGGDLTAGTNSAGKYMVVYTVSAQSAAATQDFEMAISIDDSIQNDCLVSRHFSATTTGNAGGVCILTIAAAEVIKLEVVNRTSTQNITIEDANVSLHKL